MFDVYDYYDNGSNFYDAGSVRRSYYTWSSDPPVSGSARTDFLTTLRFRVWKKALYFTIITDKVQFYIKEKRESVVRCVWSCATAVMTLIRYMRFYMQSCARSIGRHPHYFKRVCLFAICLPVTVVVGIIYFLFLIQVVTKRRTGT